MKPAWRKTQPYYWQLILLGGIITTVQAAPAPWYWWQSTMNGKQICRQTSPGEGWQQQRQAYLDARCQRPIQP